MSLVITPTIGATASALATTLGANAAIAAYHPDIRPFEGTVEQFLVQASARQPALGVVFAGGDFEPRGGAFVFIAEWVVLVVARNYRSEAARRNANADGEIGGFKLAQDVVAALALEDLGLTGLKPLEPKGIELIAAAGAAEDRTLCCYQVVFEAEHDVLHVPPEVLVSSVHNTYETRDGDDWTDVAEDLVEVA